MGVQAETERWDFLNVRTPHARECPQVAPFRRQLVARRGPSGARSGTWDCSGKATFGSDQRVAARGRPPTLPLDEAHGVLSAAPSETAKTLSGMWWPRR